ncbi:unnamed protein product, partial [Brassica rapa]
MFRQGWDPGEQMVSGDKGRVDLHYYDGTGSEIDERKQKEGFSIKNLLDLRRQCRKFGKSRWSRQIESEKSLVSFRIGEFSSIFFQSLDLDGTILVLIKTKSKDLCLSRYSVMTGVRWSLPWWNLELRRCCVRGSVIYLLPPVLYTYIYSFIRASKHEGIVCVLWSRDGTRKTMWPVSSWVDE